MNAVPALGWYGIACMWGGAMSESGVAVVIEDDQDVRNLLEGVLRQAGFEVHAAPNGREGVDLVRAKRPDVVTLDVGLPDIDGFEVLRRIRRITDAYVVMLTGRTEEPDLLNALQAGADDYIPKPFRPREMRARIAAMMRRPRSQPHDAELGPAHAAPARSVPGAGAGENGSLFRHNGLTLDFRRRTAVLNGAPLELTRSEFDLLHEILRAGGAVLSRSELVRAVRSDYYPGDSYISESDERAMEVHIGNLRRKLRDDATSPRWLQTVRGVGYRLAKDKSETV